MTAMDLEGMLRSERHRRVFALGVRGAAVDGSVAMWNENAGAVYNAREYRRLLDRLLGWDVRTVGGLATSGTGNGGVARVDDLKVTQRGAGTNMSVDVAVGAAVVGGTENAHQGNYYVYNDATVNVAISASDPVNPRIDIVGIRVRDSEYSGTSNDAAIIVVTGTPAGSPTEPTLPANFLTLARVDVPAGATQITNANITDRRRRIAALGGLIVATSSTLPTVGLWEGMAAYRTDDDEFMIYHGSQWRKPWRTPWGVVAVSGTVADHTGIGSSFTEVHAGAWRATWTAVANRWYRVTCEGSYRNSDIDQYTEVALNDLSSNLVERNFHSINSLVDPYGFHISYVFSPTAGSKTIRLMMRMSSGAGTTGFFATGQGYILVEDIGPNGNPA